MATNLNSSAKSRPPQTYWVCWSILLAIAIYGTGGLGRLWAYSAHCVHKITSLELLRGNLHWPIPPIFFIERDLQMHRGALFTNWQYGVPILQAPFHFLGSLEGLRIFPDRAIFFFYLAAMLAFLLLAVERTIFQKFPTASSR
jgi:hypothetical protein